MKSFVFRVGRNLKNRFGSLRLRITEWISRFINDFSLKVQVPNTFVESFRKSKGIAVRTFPSGDRVFSWALLESDGRIDKYGNVSDRGWDEWLNQMLKFQHFQWRAPKDPELVSVSKKIKTTGRSTWVTLFKKYKLHNLDPHDSYSLPDVYYTMKFLGRVPHSVIDIGGGWGRLGMAWNAMGVKAVGVTDSIEQPYLIQHQYLSSVPGADFYEALDNTDDKKLDFNTTRGIVHFPLWFLSKIPSGSVEVVSTIQVLREITAECLEFLFLEVHRILKKGGLWYIRDNDHEYKEFCMHNVGITDRLRAIGFKLAYKSDLVHGIDIHGTPRIFQKM